LVAHLVRVLRPPRRGLPAGCWDHGLRLLLLLLLLLRGLVVRRVRWGWVLAPGMILCRGRVVYGRRRLLLQRRGRLRGDIGGRALVRVGDGRLMRQLGDGLGVLGLRAGQVELLLAGSLVLLLVLLVLVGELGVLLLVGAGVKDGLGVLLLLLLLLVLVLQIGGNLALRRDVPAVLAVSGVLSRVGRRRLLVRGGDRADGGVL